MLLIILIIIIIITIIQCRSRQTINIYYLEKYKLEKLLKSDFDNFYDTISECNLQLRNINNKYHFINNIGCNIYYPSKYEKKIINNAIIKAHNKLKNINYIGFDYNKFKKYPWIIGISIGDNYEFGYPHTRGNIIILNYNNIYNNDLYKTLIHERIHIYQKTFPDDIKYFLKYFNFKIERKKEFDDLHNPDTDNLIYSSNNIIYECKIKNNKLCYTNESSEYEHPYEFMSYKITNLIN